MNTLFSIDDTEAVIGRIRQLTPESRAQWGKMNANQMLAHCSSTMEVVRDQKQLKRLFMGYVMGGFLKKSFYNEKEFGKNSPTHPYFVPGDIAVFDEEKARLIAHLRAFQQDGPAKCTRQPHAFFGKLTPEQWGIGMFKHTDHHLRQFGV